MIFILEDVNECDLEENLCLNGFCSNLQGSYKCECDPGYEAVDDGKMCQGILIILVNKDHKAVFNIYFVNHNVNCHY